MGYIEETGVAQHYRDIRIAAIYEGTNGIQAMDLVGRKLPMRGGRRRRRLPHASSRRSIPSSVSTGRPLSRTVRDATAWLLTDGATDPNDAFAGATPYLRMFGLLAGGWVMARQAIAARRVGDDAKLTSVRFYIEELLPQVHGLLPAVTSGRDVLFALTPEQLDSRR